MSNPRPVERADSMLRSEISCPEDSTSEVKITFGRQLKSGGEGQRKGGGREDIRRVRVRKNGSSHKHIMWGTAEQRRRGSGEWKRRCKERRKKDVHIDSDNRWIDGLKKEREIACGSPCQ